MKVEFEWSGDEIAGFVLLGIILALLLGVVGPCIQTYGVKGSRPGIGSKP